MTPGAEPSHRRSRHRWVERTLIAFGLACLLFYAFVTAQSAIYQRRAKAAIVGVMAAHEPSTMTRTAPRPASPAPLARGALIGRVDVPRLNLSAAIAEGDDDSTLGKAVGHLPDTPLPWQAGNAAFAAHRDGLFRPLRDIRLNDDVKVVTPRGEFLYRVTKTQVVNPEDVWVLAPTSTATITLITCYPFSFVGHAPQRFIVQAERVVPELAGTAFKGTVAR
jgi:LPXTG-site transpeptidase (sortase) family protein